MTKNTILRRTGFLPKRLMAIAVVVALFAGFGITQAHTVLSNGGVRAEGEVLEFSKFELVVEADDGHVIVFHHGINTQYIPGKAEVEVGDRVFVRSDKVGGSGNPIAKIVRELKDGGGDGYGGDGYGQECSPRNTGRAEVTVKNIEFLTVVFKGQAIKYVVSNNTEFKYKGQTITFADIQVGDHVEVVGKKCEGKNFPQATKVHVIRQAE